MTFLDNQLREHNPALTLAALCFLLLSFILAVFIPTFFTMWDQQNIEEGLYPESMSLVAEGSVIPQWTFDAFGHLYELMLALAVWLALNVVQMCCLAIDQLREMMRTRDNPSSSTEGEK